MNPRLRRSVDTLLVRSPMQPLFRRRSARKLAVLAYHGIDDPESFEAQLIAIRLEMHPVELDEVIDAMAGRRQLPDRAVLLTFDDGHRSIFESGLPLMLRHGLPGVAFVVAGLIGSTTPFWWTEVRELAARGDAPGRYAGLQPTSLVRALKRVPDHERREVIETLRDRFGPATPQPQLGAAELKSLESAGIVVGNHSLTHPCLDRCSLETIRSEIRDADDRIGDALGHRPRSFAYPDGSTDARVIREVAEIGYDAAFLFDHRFTEPFPTDPLRLSRLMVDSTADLPRFRMILSGLHPAIVHARNRSLTR